MQHTTKCKTRETCDLHGTNAATYCRDEEESSAVVVTVVTVNEQVLQLQQSLRTNK